MAKMMQVLYELDLNWELPCLGFRTCKSNANGFSSVVEVLCVKLVGQVNKQNCIAYSSPSELRLEVTEPV